MTGSLGRIFTAVRLFSYTDSYLNNFLRILQLGF